MTLPYSNKILLPWALAMNLAAACGASGTSPDGGTGGSGDTGGTSDGGASATGPTAQEVEAQFFAAFRASDFAAIDNLTAMAQQVHDADPSNTRNTMILGGAYLWQFGESGRLSDPTAASMLHSHAEPLAAQYLHEAVMRGLGSPIGTTLYGILLYRSGQPAQSEDLFTQLNTTSPQAVAFGRAFARRYEPVDSPRTQEAVEGLWGFFDRCAGATLDRNNPDYTPYVGKITSATYDFCGTPPHSPHTLETLFLLMGDLLVKQNHVDAGRVFYNNTRLVPGDASWPHKTVVDGRLSSDLAARAATYQRPDRTQWAEVLDPPYECTMCHGANAP